MIFLSFRLVVLINVVILSQISFLYVAHVDLSLLGTMIVKCALWKVITKWTTTFLSLTSSSKVYHKFINLRGIFQQVCLYGDVTRRPIQLISIRQVYVRLL